MQDKIKKLHWKCRRGMKEMDILFEHYLYEHYQTADLSHKQAFEIMCDMQDPIIAEYLYQRSISDNDAVNDIIAIMRLYSASKN